MAEKVELEVPGRLEGERLDKVLAEMLEVSRSRASALADSGVELDGNPARGSDRVSAGQVISCELPRERGRLEPEQVEFGVLYEDDAVIVVDKPPGLVVHPGSANQRGTLVAGLVGRYPDLAEVGPEDRSGLVHRLDKDTSGALLVARTEDSFEALSDDIRARRVGRVYTSLVEGRLGAATGTIDAPIGRDPSRPTRRAVTHTGKHARTHYEVVDVFEGSGVTLLEVRLETGRTHQIRVHMSAIGHPVVGDLNYGATRKDIGSPRTFLHAFRLEFSHPSSGARMTVESPLPLDLASVLERLS